MPCRWKKQGFSSGLACVSSMTGKVDDPNTFCYGQDEALIHADFLKIYRQFIKHCKDETEGANRYAVWVKALNLDDTKPYGASRREQFRWLKRSANFQLWKEDNDAKYWRFEAGFPLESMNNNVYSVRELELAARTLRGKPVNLNHKYVMKPVEIVASHFEDDIVEGVLRVPHNYRCPGCQKGKTLNDVIQDKLIINNSLEADCEFTPTEVGACEGMGFTGLALLTKDVLPGIPLTRIMPLESIMVEALQTSTNRRKKKVKKLRMEAIEQDEEPCPEGQERNPETGKCEPKLVEQEQEPCPEGEQRNPDTGECEPTSAEEQVPTVDVTPTVILDTVEPNEHGQCPEGMRINALGKCVRTEECPENQHWSAEANEGQGGCVLDTVPKPEHPETSVGTPAAPQEDVLTMGPTEQPVAGEQPPIPHPPKLPPPPAAGEQPAVTGTPAEPPTPMEPTAPGEIEPKPPHDCQDGHHYDAELDMCVPDAPIVEQVRRIKAEAKLLKEKEGVDSMHKYYENQLNLHIGHGRRLRSDLKAQRRVYDKLHTTHENTITTLSIAQKDRDSWKEKRDAAAGLRDDFERQLEEAKVELERLKSKYHSALATNLDLSKKNTKANEDYLALASKCERLKAQMNKAKSISKKITRLKT